MSLWFWIIVAGVVSYATKLVGYLVPAKWMKNERMSRIAATLTIGLLASLTVVNAFSSGQQLTFDARFGALLAAAVALVLRAQFLVVVIAGAAAAALLRLAGWG